MKPVCEIYASHRKITQPPNTILFQRRRQDPIEKGPIDL